MDLFLTIEEGALVLYHNDAIIARGVEPVRMVLDGKGFNVSSSIDFPDEYTSDADVIGFCRALRGDHE